MTSSLVRPYCADAAEKVLNGASNVGIKGLTSRFGKSETNPVLLMCQLETITISFPVDLPRAYDGKLAWRVTWILALEYWHEKNGEKNCRHVVALERLLMTGIFAELGF